MSIESSKVAPIQTRYGGYRFRSRLEARVAIFLDHLGIKWTYETQGYKLLGSAREGYLPDFKIWEYPIDGISCLFQGLDPERIPPIETFEISAFGEGPIWLEVKPQPPHTKEIQWLSILCSTQAIPGYFIVGDWGLRSWATGAMDTPILSHFQSPLDSDNQEQFDEWMESGGKYLQYPDIPFHPDWQLKQRAAQKALEARFEYKETPKRPRKAKKKPPLREA